MFQLRLVEHQYLFVVFCKKVTISVMMTLRVKKRSWNGEWKVVQWNQEVINKDSQSDSCLPTILTYVRSLTEKGHVAMRFHAKLCRE